MTYYINVWRNSQPGQSSAEPAVQYWAIAEQAIEEIVCGSPGYYYEETIRVEGQRATVIDLELPAMERDPKARLERLGHEGPRGAGR